MQQSEIEENGTRSEVGEHATKTERREIRSVDGASDYINTPFFV
jgi:hypothetical protein